MKKRYKLTDFWTDQPKTTYEPHNKGSPRSISYDLSNTELEDENESNDQSMEDDESIGDVQQIGSDQSMEDDEPIEDSQQRGNRQSTLHRESLNLLIFKMKTINSRSFPLLKMIL